MSGWLDVSVTVGPGETPVWPGSPPIELERRLDLEEGDPATDSTLRCSVHTGTHVDAPAHFIPGGETVDSLPLGRLMGRCRVIDLRGVGRVTVRDLEEADVGFPLDRLLLRTDNSARWTSEFRRDFVGLTADAASWIAERGVRLLGVDYLSVQPFDGSDEVHRVLLAAGVVILEGLCLEGVHRGEYELRCLPMKLSGAEAAPARACLRPLVEGGEGPD